MKSKKRKIASSLKLLLLDTKTCKELAEHWQRCLVNNLPNLFYGYNRDGDPSSFGQISQRVLGYGLYTNDNYEQFLSQYKKGKSYIIIHMGCGAEPGGDIPTTPPFQPFIQLINANNSKMGGYENCYQLSWEPAPPFANGRGSGGKKKFKKKANSNIQRAVFLLGGGIKITASISNLFVSSWAKAPFEKLGSLFEAAIGGIYVARVQKYIFGPETVDKIVDSITSGQKKKPKLSVLMGVELTSDDYPFGFRPVIEVADESAMLLPNEIMELNAPADYYEFSAPCPPYCKENEGG